MNNTRKKEIINLAKQLKTQYSSNPFDLCQTFGISVLTRIGYGKGFTSHTIKMPGYPTTIVLNGELDYTGQTVVCAHELGHALLHDEGINFFKTTQKNLFTDVEHEANLFAVAFLFNEWELAVPLESMSNYVLKSLLDYNIVQ
ncbi:MAG: ImmA/IrrE family metallo-endopeptidase [Pseudobutyrivibrio sp.]|nr:ImmA/IrrE family metallo-endopeptidase [Pseudobutyrivibrio sp.]